MENGWPAWAGTPAAAAGSSKRPFGRPNSGVGARRYRRRFDHTVPISSCVSNLRGEPRSRQYTTTGQLCSGWASASFAESPKMSICVCIPAGSSQVLAPVRIDGTEYGRPSARPTLQSKPWSTIRDRNRTSISPARELLASTRDND